MGLITTIQRMSIHDGPGIRSTIFLKGCNLRCKWCHNPETFSFKPELEWIADKCINCGECVLVCQTGAVNGNAGIIQFNKKKCIACFDCIDVCFPQALIKVGREITPEALLREIEQDFPYFSESRGGITISGGEPMMQLEFVLDTLKLFKKANIHTAIETNLTASWDRYETILPFTDLVIADLKHIDSNLHKEWTGHENSRILKNIKKLDESQKPFWLRTPVVPGANHSEEQIEAILSFVSALKNIENFELLPFHSLANSKYKNLGIANSFENEKAVSNKEMEAYNSILQKYKIAQNGTIKEI
ncbi:glycyl-radical enzyme activating protein [uncultured Draconibacterium sp.]|uniref:glycyl-radical enzyme activating protein n=1 Tax=uncultured Draconibacterium sp. TaxID=1573823 RepID=UPI0029BFFBB0|nr:glycyl-radical enzyme activating protein [uncultured Draconibacterium sp.]